MLDALAQVIVGARKDGWLVAQSHDGLTVSGHVEFDTPRTCIDECPQSS